MAGVFAALALIGMVIVPSAAAQDTDYGCRATGLRVMALEMAVANPDRVPCRADEAGLANVDFRFPPLTGSLLSVEAKGVRATTATPLSDDDFPAGARASTTDVRIQLLGHTITASLLSSNIRGFIGPNGCEWVGDGVVTVDNLTIDGQWVEVPGAANTYVIPLGVATLHVGWGNEAGTTRALFLDGPGDLDVVMAESVATCPSPAP